MLDGVPYRTREVTYGFSHLAAVRDEIVGRWADRATGIEEVAVDTIGNTVEVMINAQHFQATRARLARHYPADLLSFVTGSISEDRGDPPPTDTSQPGRSGGEPAPLLLLAVFMVSGVVAWRLSNPKRVRSPH